MRKDLLDWTQEVLGPKSSVDVDCASPEPYTIWLGTERLARADSLDLALTLAYETLERRAGRLGQPALTGLARQWLGDGAILQWKGGRKTYIATVHGTRVATGRTCEETLQTARAYIAEHGRPKKREIGRC